VSFLGLAPVGLRFRHGRALRTLSCRRFHAPVFVLHIAVTSMTRLILTGSGMSLELADRADLVIPFSSFRFVWGPLPSPDELASYLAARSDERASGTHWSDYGRWPHATAARRDLGLVEFCRHCERVELWFDRGPNDQLQLVWLLDYFRSHPEIVGRLRLRLIDFDLISASGEELGKWQVPAVDVTNDELEIASATWRATGRRRRKPASNCSAGI
jgi:hypothetical protein